MNLSILSSSFSSSSFLGQGVQVYILGGQNKNKILKYTIYIYIYIYCSSGARGSFEPPAINVVPPLTSTLSFLLAERKRYAFTTYITCKLLKLIYVPLL